MSFVRAKRPDDTETSCFARPRSEGQLGVSEMGSNRRVVVKVGSSSVTDETGNLDQAKMSALVSDLVGASRLGGWELVLVSSGAVAAGCSQLGWNRQGLSLPEKQAAAAVGQGLLMDKYGKLFGEYGTIIGQVLLTKFDIANPQQLSHICDTMETLIANRVVPVVNENDTVAVDEIRVGENDTLAAHVAVLTNSDLLVLLTDVDGFFTSDPRKDEDAKPIPEIWEITPELASMAGTSQTMVGTGGMQTKLSAARIATEKSIDVVIANGSDSELFTRLAHGGWKGTKFHARPTKEGIKT